MNLLKNAPTLMAIPLTFTLSGCANVSESYSADGRKAYAINCSGTARGWDRCFTAAGEICGTKGYDVLDRSNDPSAVGSGAGNASGFGSFFTMSSEKTMLITRRSQVQILSPQPNSKRL